MRWTSLTPHRFAMPRAPAKPALAIVAVLAACASAPPHGAPRHAVAPAPRDPDGPHRAAVAAQVAPLVAGDVVTSLVVGLYDDGKTEIYGFGAGPHGARPDGETLYELGSITKVYTSLLLADAVQRRIVALDTPVSELLPPGVTVPTRGGAVITLGMLALHTSGLPSLPPSLAARAQAPDPYAGYGEDQLYEDLLHTSLDHAPGETIAYSNYGVGLLGFAIGRKLGGGYAAALQRRVLGPLGLHDTFVKVPAAARPRLAQGTNDDLQPVAPWTFDALAGSGALISDARDQLAFLGAELDAASDRGGPLAHQMKLTQESQLDRPGANEGLGWQVDEHGRYWHNGGTGGFRAYESFDPRTRRGVVLLASTSVATIDHLADVMFDVLDGHAGPPAVLPTPAQLAELAGTYDLGGSKLAVTARKGRLYIEGPGAPAYRLVPVSDHAFWIEELQSLAEFERDGGKVARVVFVVGDNRMAATRVDAKAASPAPAAPAAPATPAPAKPAPAAPAR